MFPQVPPRDGRMATTKRWLREMSIDPNMFFMKVVDPDNDHEIVAFARWNIYRVERPESEWMDMTPREWDEGTNVDAANEFHNAVRAKRWKFIRGQPHCCKHGAIRPLADC